MKRPAISHKSNVPDVPGYPEMNKYVDFLEKKVRDLQKKIVNLKTQSKHKSIPKNCPMTQHSQCFGHGP